jgi:REP element-mobilizing transposase RayT
MVGDLRQRICEHITENAASKNIYLDCINGTTDHLHALISLGSDQTIAKIAQLLKGESSHWVNKENPRRFKFEWQDDYFADSVSWSAVNAVRKYIADQEEHHRKRTFAEEFSEFSARHGFSGGDPTKLI